MTITLRDACANDVELLRYWDEQPHVKASDPDGDWQWEVELAREYAWREQLVAELNKKPIGFVQIIDPVLEVEHYWGDYLQKYEPLNNIANKLRAIDIWIGEKDCLNCGYGTEMMRHAIARCFSDARITAILIDPLADNVQAQRFYQRFGFCFTTFHTFNGDYCKVFRLSSMDSNID